ncbi:low molecular weight protein arginine phosphatase [bacterium]|nr:low molecular weight protein arginine phosphatase [candidate division CSSED10-310 bacterium]
MKKRPAVKRHSFQILFICSGNICRSPMAEASLRSRIPPDLKHVVSIKSAGIRAISGVPPTAEAELAAKLKGYSLRNHRSSPINDLVIETADIILCMEPNQCDYILTRYPRVASKLFPLKAYAQGEYDEIPDPFGFDIHHYRSTLELIDSELTRIEPVLWETIRQKIKK